MSSLKTVWDYMFSPKLIKIYGNGPVEKFYQPSTLEKWGDQVINSLYVIWKFGVYTSPFLVGILYQRGYFEPEGLITLTKLVTSVGVILVVSFCFRGLSRSQNPTYQNFFSTLKDAQDNMTPAVKQRLNMYDFDFAAWPVEYTPESNNVSRQRLSVRKSASHHSLVQYVINIPYKIISYVAIHTFGIRLIYPGTIGFFQVILEQSLLQGRSRLIELYRGERFKIQTADNNEIDTMFINRRNASPNGNTLVICCEGNAGFYEIGITVTPIEAGYSVLGWNHPGFAGSTGRPYPSQEQNAIDAVIQFAINKLGFRPENILMFGWSIGGYPATWAVMNYPEIKGIILDATFDDILPLAVNHMPSWWEPIVKLAIREYVDLNIFEQLSKYSGPVSMIRRTEDEVICLKENDLSSNRGNHLLVKLLRQRYPCIYDDTQTNLLFDYLSGTQGSQDDLFKRYSIDENMCQSLLQSYISEYSKSYPMRIGEEFSSHEKTKMAMFLARKYMKDFKSTHCVSLPSEMFEQPWDVNVESDFIFT
ncbi:protein ABHD16A isoform X2 [Anoplophora glabripennis]|uniref:protein ABHD16A isoform X2 n=1 Tax=Anoplophora glabripennis TaxID=217634 RepID=UPI000873A37F|nr:protein ABHD16A isoform X2 [Anoplophora glabripennis]